MNGSQSEQERLAMLGAAFETGCMIGRAGALGGGAGRCPSMRAWERPVAEPEERSIVHRVPSVPIMLDGVQAPAERVKEFDGQPLYYVLNNRESEGVLQVFTSPDKLAERYSPREIKHRDSMREERVREERERVSPRAASQYSGEVWLFEHTNYYGNYWVFSGDSGNVPDFRSVDCFLWWCTNINDRVSSVWTGITYKYNPDVMPWTVLFEHINFQGSILAILNQPPETRIPDLSSYGWNDRASSMAYRLNLYPW